MQPERHFCEIGKAFSQRAGRVKRFILLFIQRSQIKKKDREEDSAKEHA